MILWLLILLFLLLFNFEKEKRTFINLQNGEQKAYVFQQNSPSNSLTRRKQYLHRKTTGMRVPNKISDMKSNDSNVDLHKQRENFILKRSFITL